MDTVNIHEAKTQFSKLLERVATGEEIIIARAGKPIARLVEYRFVEYRCEDRTRNGGQWQGFVRLRDDFDAPLPDEVTGPFTTPFMRTSYLLDTPVLLWWLSDPGKLRDDARALICDGANSLYLSSAAIWEMSIKKALGRLDMPNNLEEILRQEHIDVLPINAPHALALADLPSHHQDPFDRMQIAQARFEGLVLATRDREIANYDVEIIKA